MIPPNQPVARFKRPLPQEVTEYAFSIGFKLNGEHFCDFYESKGWMVGKSPMKNWQAAVRTWKWNAPPEALVGKKFDSAKMETKKEEARSLMDDEWNRRQAAKQAAIRDQMRTERMEESYGND